MMRNLFQSLAVVAAFAVTTGLQAETHELSGGTNIGVPVYKNGESDFSINASTKYFYNVGHGLQVGADADLRLINGDDDNNFVDLYLAGRYNVPTLGDSLAESMFIELGVGADDLLDEVDLTFGVNAGIGQRFAIADGWAFTPSLDMTWRDTDGDFSDQIGVDINLLHLSVFF